MFSRTAYSMIKERLKSKGVADITAKELEGYFSPWHAKHIGQIKVNSDSTHSNLMRRIIRSDCYQLIFTLSPIVNTVCVNKMLAIFIY